MVRVQEIRSGKNCKKLDPERTHHDRIVELRLSKSGVDLGGLPHELFTLALGVHLESGGDHVTTRDN